MYWEGDTTVNASIQDLKISPEAASTPSVNRSLPDPDTSPLTRTAVPLNRTSIINRQIGLVRNFAHLLRPVAQQPPIRSSKRLRLQSETNQTSVNDESEGANERVKKSG